MQKYEHRTDGFEFPEGELRRQRRTNPNGTVGDFRNPPVGAMLMRLISGGQKYTKISVPSLFIFANPHSLGAWVDPSADPSVLSDAKAYYTALDAMTERQEKSVESGVPTARVITISHANHYVFLSNETECLRAVQAFLLKVTQPNLRNLAGRTRAQPDGFVRLLPLPVTLGNMGPRLESEAELIQIGDANRAITHPLDQMSPHPSGRLAQGSICGISSRKPFCRVHLPDGWPLPNSAHCGNAQPRHPRTVNP